MINQEFEKVVISLLKSALKGTRAEVPLEFDWQELFSFAKSQSLVPLMYQGVTNSGITLPDDIANKMNSIALKHLWADQQQQFEIAKLESAFEKNSIDYMPIKGVLLRHLYPNTEMRPMGDADIMIRVEQKDKAAEVMESLGYAFSYETAHEIVYGKGAVVIELHKCLIPPRTKDFYEYYKDSWSFAQKVEGHNFRYEMSDEDHLIFLITHFAKHYRAGGIGVLHMADIYLYLSTKELNNRYVRDELNKLQILKFYDNVVSTIENWFNNGLGNERIDLITDWIFKNGLWGTSKSRTMAAAVRTSKSTSVKSIGFKYMIGQVFPRIEGMQLRYPVLKKHKYLLPFMWIARWLDLLLFKRNRVRNKIKQIELTNEKSVSAYQEELQYVGLDFNYKE